MPVDEMKLLGELMMGSGKECSAGRIQELMFYIQDQTSRVDRDYADRCSQTEGTARAKALRDEVIDRQMKEFIDLCGPVLSGLDGGIDRIVPYRIAPHNSHKL